jgi:hypothetical protein
MIDKDLQHSRYMKSTSDSDDAPSCLNIFLRHLSIRSLHQAEGLPVHPGPETRRGKEVYFIQV